MTSRLACAREDSSDRVAAEAAYLSSAQIHIADVTLVI
jgi:hypothetical protein